MENKYCSLCSYSKIETINQFADYFGDGLVPVPVKCNIYCSKMNEDNNMVYCGYFSIIAINKQAFNDIAPSDCPLKMC